MKLSEKVTATVADREGMDPADLDPLADAINPDSLDQLFESTGGTPKQQNGIVAFQYMGYAIMVTSSGEVSLD